MDDDLFHVGAVDIDEGEADTGFGGGQSGDDGPAGPVEDLIPPIVHKAIEQYPGDVTRATFGYDIQKMKERPWARPDAVLSDYFNYGFTEKSWRIYCAMQSEGREPLKARAESFYSEIEGIVAPSFAARALQTYDGSLPTVSVGGLVFPPSAGPANNMPPNGVAAFGGQPMQRNPANEGFFKTKLCQRYQEGRCTRGESCNYAHGNHELRATTRTNTASNAGPTMPMPSSDMHQNMMPIHPNVNMPMPSMPTHPSMHGMPLPPMSMHPHPNMSMPSVHVGGAAGGAAPSMMPMGVMAEGGGILSMPPSHSGVSAVGMYGGSGGYTSAPAPPPPNGGYLQPPSGFRKRERSADRDGGAVFEPPLK